MSGLGASAMRSLRDSVGLASSCRERERKGETEGGKKVSYLSVLPVD